MGFVLRNGLKQWSCPERAWMNGHMLWHLSKQVPDMHVLAKNVFKQAYKLIFFKLQTEEEEKICVVCLCSNCSSFFVETVCDIRL